MSKQKDLSGLVFGCLTVESFSSRDIHRHSHWQCSCSCGASVVVAQQNLRSGATVSCGHIGIEMRHANASHGHARVSNRSSEYQSWTSMLARVRAQKGQRWLDYGSRGIIVCDAWLSFDIFLADMGPRPEGTSIDRIDNDGNYEPGNCRWATDSEQVRNRRSPSRVAADRGSASIDDSRFETKEKDHEELGDI